MRGGVLLRLCLCCLVDVWCLVCCCCLDYAMLMLHVGCLILFGWLFVLFFLGLFACLFGCCLFVICLGWVLFLIVVWLLLGVCCCMLCFGLDLVWVDSLLIVLYWFLWFFDSFCLFVKFVLFRLCLFVVLVVCLWLWFCVVMRLWCVWLCLLLFGVVVWIFFIYVV